MADLHPAVKRLSGALSPMCDISGCPTTVAEVAVPVVLRWAAGDLPSGTDDLLTWLRRHRLSTTPGVGQVLAAVRADLEAVAGAVERDTRDERGDHA